MNPLMHFAFSKEYKRENENCPSPEGIFKLPDITHGIIKC